VTTYRKTKFDRVIDVRTKLEFWLGHVAGAENIPVDRIAEALPGRADIAKDAKILVYCASGGRSASAMATMQRMGYTHVVNGGGYAEVSREITE